MTSARAAASRALCQTSRGSDSPNQTISGRQRPPHAWSIWSSGRPAAPNGRPALQFVQRASRRLPCSSSTLREPARRWSESTFWVASVKSSSASSSWAIARWPALGWARSCAALRSLYQVQTKTGSRANPSGEASSSTRCVRQRPPTPRNVGRPLSAEMPEPVRTKTDFACRNAAMTPAVRAPDPSASATPRGRFAATLRRAEPRAASPGARARRDPAASCRHKAVR